MIGNEEQVLGGMIGVIGEAVIFLVSFCDQALNFCYFIFGESMFIVLPVAVILLVAKYTVIPLIMIFRSFFINSNN